MEDKVEDTQVQSAPDSSVSDTPSESRPDEASEIGSGETRSPEQQEESAAYWQSKNAKTQNEIKKIKEENDTLQYLKVLDTQLKTDPAFQQDLAGHYNLMTKGNPDAMNTEPNYDPDEYVNMGQVDKMVQDGISKALQPMMTGLNVLAETNKVKELGLDATQADIQQAMSTPFSGSERLDYNRLKALSAASEQTGVNSVVTQIQGAQGNSPSVAGANATIQEQPEPEKTINELKDDGIIEAHKKMRGISLEIEHLEPAPDMSRFR